MINFTRRSFNSASKFQKGKLTLQKLKDKATIDGQINMMNLLFSDQFGRIHGLKVDIEHFLEQPEEFQYEYNPFKYDIAQKPFEVEGLEMPDNLVLKPDMNTLRVAPWLKHEAYVLSDIYHPESGEPLSYCPRYLAKTAENKTIQDLQISKFTFQLEKVGDDAEHLSDNLQSNNQGILMSDNNHRPLLLQMLSILRDSGIPIDKIQPVGTNYMDQFQLSFKTSGDLLTFCDNFQMTKMLLKMTVLKDGNYDICMRPNDNNHSPNTVDLKIGLKESKDKLCLPQLIRDQHFMNPSMNSWRKIRENEIKDMVLFKDNKLDIKTLISPDVNMYLAMRSLLGILPMEVEELEVTTESDEVVTNAFDKMNETYQDLVMNFKEQGDHPYLSKEAHLYYSSLASHEWEEFLEHMEFETNRLY